MSKGESIPTLLLAKKIYDDETDNDPIVHCNRFPSWHELSKEDKQKYIDRAKALR